MVYSEEEAIEKWCPMSRSCFEDMAANRDFNGGIQDSDLCKASDCMMWEWTDVDEEYGYCGLSNKR